MLSCQELYQALSEAMPADQIDHHYSDLYVKVTYVSRDLVHRYQFRRHVSTFTDQITHTLWYDIPFCYPGKIDK